MVNTLSGAGPCTSKWKCNWVDDDDKRGFYLGYKRKYFLKS